MTLYQKVKVLKYIMWTVRKDHAVYTGTVRHIKVGKECSGTVSSRPTGPTFKALRPRIWGLYGREQGWVLGEGNDPLPSMGSGSTVSGIWNFRSRALSFPERKVHRENFRSMEHSLRGTLAPVERLFLQIKRSKNSDNKRHCTCNN